MKCPKCGYISFDYNQVCPKCNKDISSEQAKMNMPSFRPDPPSLLGILTGEADESNVGFQIESPSEMGAAHGMDVNLDDAVVLEDTEAVDFDEDQDMEISLGLDDSGEFEVPGELETDQEDDMMDLGMDAGDEEITIDADTVSFEDADEDLAALSVDEESEEDVALDLGDISLEEAGEDIPAAEEIIEEDSETEISMDELPPEEPIPADEEAGLSDSSEIELDLDDLSINETGELEVTQVESAGGSEAAQIVEDMAPDDSGADTDEAPLDLGEISLDDSGETEDDALDLGDLALDDSGETEDDALDLGEISLDDDAGDDETTKMIEDLALDDSGLDEGDEAPDLDEISLDEADSGDTEKTLVFDEASSIDEVSLEDMVSDESVSEGSDGDIDLEGISLDVADDDTELDLENLDLDLDFDEPEDKS